MEARVYRGAAAPSTLRRYRCTKNDENSGYRGMVWTLWPPTDTGPQPDARRGAPRRTGREF